MSTPKAFYITHPFTVFNRDGEMEWRDKISQLLPDKRIERQLYIENNCTVTTDAC